MAGAYIAWRLGTATLQELDPGFARVPNETSLYELLKERSGRLRIHLYEQSDRIGGRLHSLRVRGMPDVRAELGGMRYHSTHQMVAGLVKQLGLVPKPFPTGDKNNLFYLRRHRLRSKDLLNAKSVPYRLAPHERAKAPADLILHAIERIIGDARRFSGETETVWKRRWERLRREAQFENKRLYELGFWDVLANLLSSEGYQFVLDAGGYSPFRKNWNAAEAIYWFLADFLAEETEEALGYQTLEKGFDRLPQTLAENFKNFPNAHIFLRHKLVSFKQDPLNPRVIKLYFEDLEHHHTVQVNAYHLILAMPQRALKLLDQRNNFFDSEQLQRDLDSVIAEPAMKLFLAYKTPWWHALKIHSGSSITDLPIRQTYYFGAQSEASPTEKDNSNSLLLAVYNYGDIRGVWGKFFEKSNSPAQGLFEIDKTVEPGYPDRLERDHLPTRALVQAVQAQLKEVHGLASDVPEPYTALVQDWGKDPYGGAWHLWKTGAKSFEIIPRIRHPYPHRNVYICGEAYSTEHAWVEGALISAENVLEKILGLKRPNWLSDDYYLGP